MKQTAPILYLVLNVNGIIYFVATYIYLLLTKQALI